MPSDSEISEQEEWEELNDADFQKLMVQMDNDLCDPDWIPTWKRAKTHAEKATGECDHIFMMCYHAQEQTSLPQILCL